jgi:hypothetical protein
VTVISNLRAAHLSEAVRASRERRGSDHAEPFAPGERPHPILLMAVENELIRPPSVVCGLFGF